VGEGLACCLVKRLTLTVDLKRGARRLFSGYSTTGRSDAELMPLLHTNGVEHGQGN
jgi:hypothetical protein